jgi:hypothetical protein
MIVERIYSFSIDKTFDNPIIISSIIISEIAPNLFTKSFLRN